MGKKWTRLEEKNDFLGSSNRLIAEVTVFLHEFSAMTEFDVVLPNIGLSYQNKMLELEEQFQEKGLDYFSKEQYEVRNIIIWDMLHRIKKATDILEQKIKWLKGFFLLNQIKYFKAFSNRMIEWFLKDYIAIVEEMQNYKMETDFAKSMVERLYNNNYDAMSPGSYQTIWEESKKIFMVFGLEEQMHQIEQEIIALVEAQEIASLDYLKSWNHHNKI